MTDILKYIATARFIGGTVVGALTAAGLIGPEWGSMFSALFGN